jgi:hypothetical protein
MMTNKSILFINFPFVSTSEAAFRFLSVAQVQRDFSFSISFMFVFTLEHFLFIFSQSHLLDWLLYFHLIFSQFHAPRRCLRSPTLSNAWEEPEARRFFRFRMKREVGGRGKKGICMETRKRQRED